MTHDNKINLKELREKMERARDQIDHSNSTGVKVEVELANPKTVLRLIFMVERLSEIVHNDWAARFKELADDTSYYFTRERE